MRPRIRPVLPDLCYLGQAQEICDVQASARIISRDSHLQVLATRARPCRVGRDGTTMLVVKSDAEYPRPNDPSPVFPSLAVSISGFPAIQHTLIHTGPTPAQCLPCRLTQYSTSAHCLTPCPTLVQTFERPKKQGLAYVSRRGRIPVIADHLEALVLHKG